MRSCAVNRVHVRFTVVMGLLDQVHVVEGARIVRVEPDGLFQFDFGLIELAHFVKQLAVAAPMCLLPSCHWRYKEFAAPSHHRAFCRAWTASSRSLLFLERQSGGILRVHFQHAVDLRGGFVQITLTLRLTGERKPGGSQAGNGLRRFVGQCRSRFARPTHRRPRKVWRLRANLHGAAVFLASRSFWRRMMVLA